MEIKNIMPEEPPVEKEPSVTVCDIEFRTGTKTYYFDPNGLQLKAGDEVILETARGSEYGVCVRGNHGIRPHEVVTPLRPVLRIATPQDKRIHADNLVKERRAFDICLKKIAELGLEMQLVSAEYAFDGSKIMFFFTADGRVDFRELVKNLASALRTRIELRQIGVRDKAKMVGGLGVCGRPFCCREFLEDFQPVSIKMAKTQNLSLNPTKISGTCGRLMCCLNYEQEAYEELLRTSPKAESFVDTPDGRGTVTEVNLLKQSVRVRLENQPDTLVCHKNCDICVLRNGKAKKTDPPIPADFAPISGNPQKKKEETPFTTYLEPVVLRGTGKAIETTALTEQPAQEAKPKRRRRGGKNHRPKTEPAAPQKAPAAAVQKAVEAHPQKHEQPTKPSDVPRKEVKPQNAEGAKNNHYRNYRKRRKSSGNKPNGSGG